MPDPTPASGPGTYRSIFLGHSSITARERLTIATSSIPAGNILTACAHRIRAPMPDRNPAMTMCGR